MIPKVGAVVAPPTVDTIVRPPKAVALLGAGSVLPDGDWPSTTVSDRPRVKRVAPPSLDALKGTPSAARLVIVEPGAQRTDRTIVATGSAASTRAARSTAVAVAVRGGSDTARLATFTDTVASRTRARARAGSAGASELRGGETIVLALPNARRDVGEGDRPTFDVAGCPCRVVVIGDGGDVMSDEIVTNTSIEVRSGAERIAVHALGDPAPIAPLAGRHSGLPISYVGWSAGLCPGAVVQVSDQVIDRHRNRGHAGIVEAAELVGGRTTVTTRFAKPVDVIVVAIDEPIDDAGLNDANEGQLLLGLDGATQATDKSGEPIAPFVIVAGNRSLLAYRVIAKRGPVTVTVASGERWHLVGVFGGIGDPGTIATALAVKGYDTQLATHAPPGVGAASIRWRGEGPAKKQPAKRRRTRSMVDRGHFVLHSYVKPQVTAGRYQLHATQPGSGVTIEAHDGEVYVSSPRYVMPPDQILSTFPPAMAQGDFGGRLPQIALKRRTIAWERRPDPSRPANEEPPVPWLALVVIAEGEGSLSPGPKPVAECITPGLLPLPDPTDTDSATGFYLSVPDSVVKKVFPTISDLPLLVHVREVDIRDTELASGDDDGWLAVVLANRLPIALPDKPVKYLACLGQSRRTTRCATDDSGDRRLPGRHRRGRQRLRVAGGRTTCRQVRNRHGCSDWRCGINAVDIGSGVEG